MFNKEEFKKAISVIEEAYNIVGKIAEEEYTPTSSHWKIIVGFDGDQFHIKEATVRGEYTEDHIFYLDLSEAYSEENIRKTFLADKTKKEEAKRKQEEALAERNKEDEIKRLKNLLEKYPEVVVNHDG